MNKPPDDLDSKILQFCREKKKLEAIKLYKDTMNVSLKQSKEYVERLATQNGIKMPVGKHACFIATACYGDYDAYEVLLLRNFRDEKLMPTKAGKIFVKLYYATSPGLARIIKKNERLRNFTRKYILSIIVNELQERKFR